MFLMSVHLVRHKLFQNIALGRFGGLNLNLVTFIH